MAIVLLDSLLPVFPEVSDDAQEIGAMPRWTEHSAMRIGHHRDEGCELVYLGETPVRARTAWKVVDYWEGSPDESVSGLKKQGPGSRKGSEKRHRWWRLEFRVDTIDNQPIKRDHSLVISMYPYSGGWVHCTPFRRSLRRGPQDRPDPLIQAFRSPTELMQWIEGLELKRPKREGLKCDFWAKGAVLTAGVSEPDPAFNLGLAIRDLDKPKVGFVLGTCESFAAYMDELKETCFEKLLAETKNETIKFVPEHVTKKSQKTIPEDFRSLHGEVKADSGSLIDLSIRQALAGPHKESEKWEGKPVATKVRQIYREHLYNHNRVVAIRHRKESQAQEPNAIEEFPGEYEAKPFEGLDEERYQSIKQKFGLPDDVPAHAIHCMLSEIVARDIPRADMKAALQALIKAYRRGLWHPGS